MLQWYFATAKQNWKWKKYFLNSINITIDQNYVKNTSCYIYVCIYVCMCKFIVTQVVLLPLSLWFGQLRDKHPRFEVLSKAITITPYTAVWSSVKKANSECVWSHQSLGHSSENDMHKRTHFIFFLLFLTLTRRWLSDRRTVLTLTPLTL